MGLEYSYGSRHKDRVIEKGPEEESAVFSKANATQKQITVSSVKGRLVFEAKFTL